jgi:hypothetical protein
MARGYAPALIYYAGVSVGVYLISVQYQTKVVGLDVVKTGIVDKVNLIVYAGVIAGLIYLMGISQMSPMLAALRVFVAAGIAVSLIFFITGQEPSSRNSRTLASFPTFYRPIALTTYDLTLLPPASIMTGVVVIRRDRKWVSPDRGGRHTRDCGGFLFGASWTGFPPPLHSHGHGHRPRLIKAGIQPGSFTSSIFVRLSELTPPASLVARHRKDASAHFVGTCSGIQLCSVLFCHGLARPSW